MLGYILTVVITAIPFYHIGTFSGMFTAVKCSIDEPKRFKKIALDYVKIFREG